ncbi:MAG: DNA-3-methyladenine glycosylase 2 family protein [Planctomycetes bacterium]|nr:DNA-3-methyladenine glycosylase 2 family protein [Planctomycetota bacterium]
MTTDAECMARFLRRDRAWDGRFLTGVITTGIYCLASCPARRPKPENVRIFRSEPEARGAGLRPCKRCRPDRFLAAGDPDIALYDAVHRAIAAEPGAFARVADVAARAGVGATRLNELFRRHGHTTPLLALQRAKVAAAAERLLTTDDRMLDVALDVGFASQSVFHDNFRAVTGTTPRAYRALRDGVEFALELPADFRHRDTLRQLGRDPAAPDQRVDGRRCAKALWLDGVPGVLELDVRARVARCAVRLRRRASRGVMAAAHLAALRLLGLDADPGPFERRARRDPDQRRLTRPRPGLRVLRNGSPFEAFCWSVIGQQINLALAFRCRTAMFELADSPRLDGMSPHPTPAAVADIAPATLRQRQFSGRKIEYLQDTARAIEGGELALDELADGSAVHAERTLLALRGVGPWSSNYVMMRGFGFGDCAPIGDTGITAALQAWLELVERPDAAATERLLAPFSPYRSLACWHLWRSLDRPEPTETEETP